jgi:MtN3 and saliva related transmembrane protein
VEIVTIIGSLAAIASTTSFAPQAWKIVKERRARDISARMYALSVVAFSLWLTYGVLKREWPIIVPNFLCLMMSAFILLMRLLPRPQRNAVAEALDPTSRDG